MKGSTRQPKVFISYSWSSPEHEAWVLEFGERLLSDGILVILDKWDLKEGQDKYAFMELMVTDKKINKVLVICDKRYRDKADSRDGGVGTETQIISKKVYENVEQEKFISIVKDRNDSGEPYLPSYMSSRVYIDLSTDENYENNYQRLIKILYGQPVLKKPPVGVPPPYITEKSSVELKTAHKTEQVKMAILNERKNKNALVSDYFSEFLTSLKDFKVKPDEGEHFDDAVMKNIESLQPLRDDFINFTLNIFKYDDQVNLEELHNFFEKLISFQFKPVDVTSWREIDYDNYRFFCYEIFLYFITALLNLKKYKEISYFINNQYFFRRDNVNDLMHFGPTIFNRYIPVLDEVRKNRLKLNRVSITADLIKERANREDFPFDNLIQTDLILHYLTVFNVPDDSMQWWFPRCSVYNSHWVSIDLFERLISKKHFEQIKTLFDVSTKEALKKKMDGYIEALGQNQRGGRYYNDFYYRIPKMTDVIKIDEVATV